jgi:hypothetical protein
MEKIYLYSLLPSPKVYVAMAGCCSNNYQFWVYDHRNSSDSTKLPVKRSKKPIALDVCIDSDSVIGHVLCFFHVRHAIELYIDRRNWYHVVYLDIPEGEILKITKE